MPGDTWINEICPKCKEVNWICLGDLSDLTVADIDAAECWKCFHVWFLSEDSELRSDPDETDPKKSNVEAGVKVAGEHRTPKCVE